MFGICLIEYSYDIKLKTYDTFIILRDRLGKISSGNAFVYFCCVDFDGKLSVVYTGSGYNHSVLR